LENELWGEERGLRDEVDSLRYLQFVHMFLY
jgi:hypothetical protein